MDLSILVYNHYDRGHFMGRIECVGFDHYGYPIYSLELTSYYMYQRQIHYDTELECWIETSDDGFRVPFRHLGPPRRFHPLPSVWDEMIYGGQSNLDREIATCFYHWSKTYSSKIVSFSWTNYRKGNSRSRWLINDIAMIILVVVHRLQIRLPPEMLEAILGHLNIIIH